MVRAWSVNVELAETAVDDDIIDQIHEALSSHCAAVGFAPNGKLSVQLTVETVTARQALDASLKAVTRAARDNGLASTVSGVELLLEEEFDRRLATPDIPELVGLSEVAERLGVTRQRAGQLAAHEAFPPAVAQLKSGPVFIADQVAAYGKRRKRSSGRPVKAATGDPGQVMKQTA